MGSSGRYKWCSLEYYMRRQSHSEVINLYPQAISWQVPHTSKSHTGQWAIYTLILWWLNELGFFGGNKWCILWRNNHTLRELICTHAWLMGIGALTLHWLMGIGMDSLLHEVIWNLKSNFDTAQSGLRVNCNVSSKRESSVCQSKDLQLTKGNG